MTVDQHAAQDGPPNSQPGSDLNVDPNFGPMVRRAAIVAAIGWVTKVASMVKVARDLGGETSVRRWGPGIPYLSFGVPRDQFQIITSKSTVVLALVMLAVLVTGILKNTGRVQVAGWCFAFVVLGNAIAVDLLMQHFVGRYTDTDRLRWAVGCLSLMSLLVAWWIAIERPHGRLIMWRRGAGEPEVAVTASSV
jgi:hypothetical protein